MSCSAQSAYFASCNLFASPSGGGKDAGFWGPENRWVSKPLVPYSRRMLLFPAWVSGLKRWGYRKAFHLPFPVSVAGYWVLCLNWASLKRLFSLAVLSSLTSPLGEVLDWKYMVYVWYFPGTAQEILSAVYRYVVSHTTVPRFFFVIYAICCSQSGWISPRRQLEYPNPYGLLWKN